MTFSMSMNRYRDIMANYVENFNKNSQYGLQMSMTLSSHPFLNDYLENIRDIVEKEVAEELVRNCGSKTLPRRTNYPTIIIRGNEESDRIHMLMCDDFTRYLDDGEIKLKEAPLDEAYYGRRIFIKDFKYKEIDPVLLKPIAFNKGTHAVSCLSTNVFWNTPLIFIGFHKLIGDDIFRTFVNTLYSNPIGKTISSPDFLDYMSQPVVFWITPWDLSEGWGDSKVRYDILEYRITNNSVTTEIFRRLKDNYLKSIGRKLLASRHIWDLYYLEPPFYVN